MLVIDLMAVAVVTLDFRHFIRVQRRQTIGRGSTTIIGYHYQ